MLPKMALLLLLLFAEAYNTGIAVVNSSVLKSLKHYCNKSPGMDAS
jgi:hypothetical protein